MSLSDQYWMHVPLETTPGMLLNAPFGNRVNVLGRSAQLLDREPYVSFITSSAMIIKQWLLFDPTSRVEAENILAELRARMPVLSMNMGANFRIPIHELCTSQLETYDGTQPTLIPASLHPRPTWFDWMGSCSWNAQEVLETTLNQCTSVTDERLLSALDLYITSQYDYLPRSRFLAKLTILDTLAVNTKRDDPTITWLDEKISEVKTFDTGLAQAVGNLKYQSHTTAIKALVSRAVRSQGGSVTDAEQQVDNAGRLYKIRSKLSHKGLSTEIDLAGAAQLARLVLNAAINNPSILDIGTAIKPVNEHDGKPTISMNKLTKKKLR